jgi:AmiR/NasT family two-component response regulator
MSAPLASSGPRGLEPRPPRPGLLELVREVATTSITDPGAEDVPRRVCERLARLDGLTGCAVVLFDDSADAVRTLVASHPEAEQLTRLVQQLGLGIGAGAIRAGRDSAVEDLTRSVRAGLADAAQRVGLPVTAVVALRAADRLVGCLQLYSRTLDAVTDGLLEELVPLAAVLGSVLGNIEAYRHSASLVSRLTVALDRQGPIEQAKGLLAERHQVDLDTAYRMLRDQAARQSTTVSAVAAAVVGQSWRTANHHGPVPGPTSGAPTPGAAPGPPAGATGPAPSTTPGQPGTVGPGDAALPEQRGGPAEVQQSHPAG